MRGICGTVLLAVGIFLAAGCAVQKVALTEAQVPAGVKQTFHEKFPQVATVDWVLKSGNYEAEFSVQQVEMAVKIDPAGKWLETETTIAPAGLPQAVRDTAAGQFKDYQIIETQTMLRAGTPTVTYELHLDNGKEIVKVEISAEGAVLAKSAKPKP